MVQTRLNALVVAHLAANSRRPIKALQIWAHLMDGIRADGNDVRFSRRELAARAECHPNDVTNIIRELEKVGAVYRTGPGRYHVNPMVCTHLTGEARMAAQKEAPPLRLTGIRVVANAA